MRDVHPLVSIALFIASSVVGYLLIKNVPSLLHTPLMSGMNALSGITVIGAIAVTAAAESWFFKAIGLAALAFSMVNVAGGFSVTDRMLAMFRGKEDGDGR